MKRKRALALGFASLFALIPAAHAAITERGFIDGFLTVPSSVNSVVGAVLPESSQVGKSYLSGAFDPNLTVSADANVFITFVHEGAGYRNSLEYFTYTTNGDDVTIIDRQLVFPNASFADPNKGWGGGQLVTGDTVTLRDANGQPRVFHSGERIGFFLVADGWTGTGVRNWNASNPAWPATSAASNASNRVFTTIDPLNPENSTGRADVARHVAMLRVGGSAGFLDGADFLLMGFEDQRRDTGSDNDFNDLVVLVRSNPITAIQSNTPLPYYVPNNPDPDGDGVNGLLDWFPLDPSRAFVTRTPVTGWNTVAFEDRYPAVGDADYNDCVVDMAFEEVLDSSNKLKDIEGTFHLVARGASLDHKMGVAIHGFPANASGSIRFERFASDGTHVIEDPAPLAERFEADAQGQIMIALDDVFPSTMTALPGDDGLFANTTHASNPIPPASSRFLITFDTAITRAPLGAAPFDPFLEVIHDGELWDVHLRGKSGFPGRSASLPTESGTDSFLDDNGYPFALLIPVAFRYPLERTPINGTSGAYPDFDAWRASRGAQKSTWYKFPSAAQPARVIDASGEAYHSRPWTVSAIATGP